MSAELDPLLKRLHLANARRVWRDLVQRAEKEEWAYDARQVHRDAAFQLPEGERTASGDVLRRARPGLCPADHRRRGWPAIAYPWAAHLVARPNHGPAVVSERRRELIKLLRMFRRQRSRQKGTIHTKRLDAKHQINREDLIALALKRGVLTVGQRSYEFASKFDSLFGVLDEARPLSTEAQAFVTEYDP